MSSSAAMRVVFHVVGARPNFIKVAPIYRAIAERGVLRQRLIHTGQHYDAQMSGVFFSDLRLPTPDVHLGAGSGSHAEQTGKVMMELEKVCASEKPDLISVVGDVNSTLAAALVAAKAQITLAHVEAGLRSRDRSMPEEINRILTDRLADLLLTPSPDADENLRSEGVEEGRIFFVGNVMIDEPAIFGGLLEALGEISRLIPVIFPVHPRTRKMLCEANGNIRLPASANLRLVEPMGYLEFLSLTSQARLILTDSGGLQEEATALDVPCLTLRENTERPITVTEGTNVVVGTRPERIIEEAQKVLTGRAKQGRIPERWDGRAGRRIAEVFANALGRL